MEKTRFLLPSFCCLSLFYVCWYFRDNLQLSGSSLTFSFRGANNLRSLKGEISAAHVVGGSSVSSFSSSRDQEEVDQERSLQTQTSQVRSSPLRTSGGWTSPFVSVERRSSSQTFTTTDRIDRPGISDKTVFSPLSAVVMLNEKQVINTPNTATFNNSVTCSQTETKFLNNGSKRPKIGLISYPRSGNSMTRVLIERLTGIWTGSYGIDPLLQRYGFRGEGYIDDTVSVIKDHVLEGTIQGFEEKKYDKLIYLYRNPFDVFLSRMVKLVSRGRHNLTRSFDPAVFNGKVKEWIPEWKRHLETFVFNLTNSSMYFSSSDGRYLPVLHIRYEDMNDPISLPTHLHRVVKFLELPQAVNRRSVQEILAMKKPRLKQKKLHHYNRTAEDFMELSPVITKERIDCVVQPEKAAGYIPRKKESKYGVDSYSVKSKQMMMSELKAELCVLGFSVLSPDLKLECPDDKGLSKVWMT